MNFCICPMIFSRSSFFDYCMFSLSINHIELNPKTYFYSWFIHYPWMNSKYWTMIIILQKRTQLELVIEPFVFCVVWHCWNILHIPTYSYSCLISPNIWYSIDKKIQVKQPQMSFILYLYFKVTRGHRGREGSWISTYIIIMKKKSYFVNITGSFKFTD